MENISEEKSKWLKEVGAKEFNKPVKFSIGTNYFLSEDYIKNTSLEKLKERYDEKLIKHGDTIFYSEDFK